MASCEKCATSLSTLLTGRNTDADPCVAVQGVAARDWSLHFGGSVACVSAHNSVPWDDLCGHKAIWAAGRPPATDP